MKNAQNRSTGSIGLAGIAFAMALVLAIPFAIGRAFIAQAQTASSTATSTAPVASSTEPVISSVVAQSSVDGTGATITWTTDEDTNSVVAYGTSSAPYTNSTAVDTNMVMSHNEDISDLNPGTLYHFAVMSEDSAGNVASSSDMTFMTASSSPIIGTTTVATSTTESATSTNVTTLQSIIAQLEQEISNLRAEITSLLSGQGTNTGSSVGAMITPVNATLPAGSVVDFNGRNFGHEETVNIVMNGVQVGSAHADGGGNFTTGSLNIPSTPGTYNYVFTGQNSGVTESSVITAQ